MGSTRLMAILKVPVILFAKIYGRTRIAKRMNNLAQKYDYDKSNWVGNFSWSQYGMRERVPKEWFTDETSSGRPKSKSQYGGLAEIIENEK